MVQGGGQRSSPFFEPPYLSTMTPGNVSRAPAGADRAKNAPPIAIETTHRTARLLATMLHLFDFRLSLPAITTAPPTIASAIVPSTLRCAGVGATRDAP